MLSHEPIWCTLSYFNRCLYSFTLLLCKRRSPIYRTVARVLPLSLFLSSECVCVCVRACFELFNSLNKWRSKGLRRNEWYIYLLPPDALRSIENVSIACSSFLLIDYSATTNNHVNLWSSSSSSSSCPIKTSNRSFVRIVIVTKKRWAGNSLRNKKRPIISFRKELETVSVLTRCNVSGPYNDQDVNIRIMSTKNMFNQQDWLGNSSSPTLEWSPGWLINRRCWPSRKAWAEWWWCDDILSSRLPSPICLC